MKTSIRTSLQVLSLAALAALAIYLAPKYSNPFKYHFEEGQPWGYGLVTAEFDFPIYKTEAQLNQEYAEVLKNYTPCYTIDPAASQSDIYVISLDEFERISQSLTPRISILNNRVATTVDINSVYTPKTAYQLKHKELAPNLLFDSITSANLRQSLLSAVSLTHGMVQAGEKIIDTGEIVTTDSYQLLVSLRRAMEDKDVSKRQSLYSVIGISVCIVLLLLLFFLYLSIYIIP